MYDDLLYQEYKEYIDNLDYRTLEEEMSEYDGLYDYSNIEEFMEYEEEII